MKGLESYYICDKSKQMLVRLLFLLLIFSSLISNAQVELLSLEGTYQEKNLIVAENVNEIGRLVLECLMQLMTDK